MDANYYMSYAPPSSLTRAQSFGQLGDTRKVVKVQLTTTGAIKKVSKHDLPLDVSVEAKLCKEQMTCNLYGVYQVTMTSVATCKQWTLKYRYSQFYAFKTQVEELYTCHNFKCFGSCQAIRNYLVTCFPKKRFMGSSSLQALDERKAKLENVLVHLLRCCLLPGSAMKCCQARRQLPVALFQFLGVDEDIDKRSLLHILVDKMQQSTKLRDSYQLLQRSSSNCTSSTISSMPLSMDDVEDVHDDCQCAICFDTIDIYEDYEKHPEERRAVLLPCKHIFHRTCIYEWLMFQFGCPLCRQRVCPPANTKYVCAKNRIQWWLGEFTQDPVEEDDSN